MVYIDLQPLLPKANKGKVKSKLNTKESGAANTSTGDRYILF